MAVFSKLSHLKYLVFKNLSPFSQLLLKIYKVFSSVFPFMKTRRGDKSSFYASKSMFCLKYISLKYVEIQTFHVSVSIPLDWLP